MKDNGLEKIVGAQHAVPLPYGMWSVAPPYPQGRAIAHPRWGQRGFTELKHQGRHIGLPLHIIPLPKWKNQREVFVETHRMRLEKFCSVHLGERNCRDVLQYAPTGIMWGQSVAPPCPQGWIMIWIAKFWYMHHRDGFHPQTCLRVDRGCQNIPKASLGMPHSNLYMNW